MSLEIIGQRPRCPPINNPAVKTVTAVALCWAMAIPGHQESYLFLTKPDYKVSNFGGLVTFPQYAMVFTVCPILYAYQQYNPNFILKNPRIYFCMNYYPWEQITKIAVLIFFFADSIEAFSHAYLRFRHLDVESNQLDPLYGVVFLIYGLCFTILPTVYVVKTFRSQVEEPLINSRSRSINSDNDDEIV